MVEDLEVFDDFCAVHEREDGLPRVRVIRLSRTRPAWHPGVIADTAHLIELPEAVYEIFPDENPELDADALPLQLRVADHADHVYDYRRRASARSSWSSARRCSAATMPSRYATERIHATRRGRHRDPDLARVPQGAARTAPQPMLLTGYGSYGYPVPDDVLVLRASACSTAASSSRSRTSAAAASSASAGTTRAAC